MTNQKKLVLGGVGVLIAVIIGVVIYSLIPRATILFSVAPTNVSVEINGNVHQVENGDRITVSPGAVSLRVYSDEFADHKEDIVLENGDQYEVLVALTPETAAAQSLLANDEAQFIIQRIAGRDLQEGTTDLVNAYPIIQDLPIIDRFYKIIICESEEHPDDASKLAVCIQLFEPAAKKSALSDLKRRGYDIADYEIIFQDLSYEAIQEEAGE